ncbi:delta(24)-sterol reductase-like [Oratosquilla oratoria]|uniref:delta(24)-sterol reductase-like n=1 Tax=Oratosquilla oratoria TaxID=337810 RepID=UPI003F767104
MGELALKQKLFRWMEDHRGIIIVFFVLPLSIIFGWVMKLHHWIQCKMISAHEGHDKKVKTVQQKVRKWCDLMPAERKMMCTARPNWQSLSTTFFRKDQCHQIPIPLYDILDLNTEKMFVRVEPMVSVGDITAFLVPRGYTLAVCLEVAEATLGGLAMGVGMTTYSHKVGLYQETILAYEMVLADGSLIRVTKDNEHRDLYYCLPWSHGTLGFLVALELQIIRIKPYLKLEYMPVRGQKEYCDKMREVSGAIDKDYKAPDYVEGTIYNKDEAVIMVGNFSDVPPDEMFKINCISAWYKPWFYKHVENFLKTGYDYEYVPLQDYLLRHNRALFWVVETMIPFGNHPLFRLLLGWMLPPRIAFLKFTTTPGVRVMTFTKQVFQDIVLPMNQLEDQINISHEVFNIYPILVYPCRIYDHEPHSGQLRPPRQEQRVPGTNYGMFNDLGVYGVPQQVKERKQFDAVDAMRKMEKFTREVGGYPFLYADTFMTREEFDQMFDMTAYEQMRKKYQAEGAFPHLFDKTKPEIDVIEVGKQFMDPL